MADFSISQFKQYVQTLINATGIDDGNGIIETKNGELAKVLSNFSLEESQIGDLLEKSANAQTRTASGEQPYPALARQGCSRLCRQEKAVCRWFALGIAQCRDMGP